MHGVAGQERGCAHAASDEQGTLGDYLRHRPCQRGAQDQEGGGYEGKENNERMREQICSERPPVAQQPEHEAAQGHEAMPQYQRMVSPLQGGSTDYGAPCKSHIFTPFSW
jgi:hypothetical protein